MTPGLRIVIADDESDMRDYLQKVLPSLGHEVVSVASTGRELVAQCRASQPDLIITDIKMPDMDGIDAVAEVCRERAIPAILVSAHYGPDLLQRIEQGTVMAYLV